MMLRFTLKQVYYFVSVAELESITRASEQINISPPSLSTAIAHLEATFGIQLFIRQHSQGLTLTGTGRQFLKEARQLLAQASMMRRTAYDMSGQLQGPLMVGCHAVFSAALLPKMWRTFKAAHKDVVWSSTIGDQTLLIDKLRSGELDVAFTDDIALPKELAFEPMACLPAQVILAADHPLCAQASVSLEELADLPLILLDIPFSRNYFLELFEAAGRKPNIVDQVSDMNLLRSMVANGFGYSLASSLPRHLSTDDGKAICSRPLSNPHQPLVVGLVSAYRDHRPKIISSFYDHCRGLIRNENAPVEPAYTESHASMERQRKSG